MSDGPTRAAGSWLPRVNRRRLLVAGLTVGVASVFRSSRVLADEDDAALATLLDEVRQWLVTAALSASSLDPFLAEWPAAAALRHPAPATLPVLRELPALRALARPEMRSITDRLVDLAPRLHWRQTYGAAEVPAGFLDRYGYTELVGLSGPEPSTRLACGVLVLGPETFYPRHHHEAEEIWVPLVGTAAWQRGDRTWTEQPPGTVIHHASDEGHAVRTGREPLLGLYLWRSANLAQRAHLDARAAPRGHGDHSSV
jgi:hypothetical protein